MSGLIAAAMGAQGLMNVFSQERANRANMELARYKFRQDKAMWEAQNLYNTPAAQMQRLAEAGLSPHLVYGGGNVTGNSAGSAPEFAAPRVNPVEIPDFMGKYLAAKNLETQTGLTKEQAANVNADTLNKIAQLPQIQANAKLSSEMAKYGAQIAEQTVQGGSLSNQKLTNEILLQGFDQEIKEMEAKLAKEGLTKSDNVVLRQLMQQLIEMGVNPSSLMQKLQDSKVGRMVKEWKGGK